MLKSRASCEATTSGEFGTPAGRVRSAASRGTRCSRSALALVGESGLRCVVVGGEAGMGKTTLLAEFAHSVTSSTTATVLYGRCDEQVCRF